MTPQKYRGAHPENGIGVPHGKHLWPTDLWVAPIVGKALVEGFFCEGIVFIGSVDLNRVLISNKVLIGTHFSKTVGFFGNLTLNFGYYFQIYYSQWTVDIYTQY